jgi:hypothetical protein
VINLWGAPAQLCEQFNIFAVSNLLDPLRREFYNERVVAESWLRGRADATGIWLFKDSQTLCSCR